MSSYKVGSICILNSGNKNRPFLILNDGVGVDIDITTLNITTKTPRNEFDVEVKHWEEAGLHKPSIVRCSKLNTINPGDPLFIIGKLHREDFETVCEKVKLYISKGLEAFQE